MPGIQHRIVAKIRLCMAIVCVIGVVACFIGPILVFPSGDSGTYETKLQYGLGWRFVLRSTGSFIEEKKQGWDSPWHEIGHGNWETTTKRHADTGTKYTQVLLKYSDGKNEALALEGGRLHDVGRGLFYSRSSGVGPYLCCSGPLIIIAGGMLFVLVSPQLQAQILATKSDNILSASIVMRAIYKTLRGQHIEVSDEKQAQETNEVHSQQETLKDKE